MPARTIRLLAGLAAALALTASLGGCAPGGTVRTHMTIVGSSTVYPFSKLVAERFVRNNPGARSPVLEQNGTGAGIKLFCNGVGAGFPDIANASRRMKPSEAEQCLANGVRQIVEVPIGIDGLALIEARNAPPFELTVRDVYAALAARPFGRPQRARTWAEIDPRLPAIPIQVYGPPPTSGTRDAFAELVLTKGCETDPAMKALKTTDEDRHKAICTGVREDGAFIEAGENDNLLVQKVTGNPGSLGIMGYSFLEENADRIRGVPLNGVAPTAAAISSFDYPGARPLYMYVKGEHLRVIPGVRAYVAEFANAWGAGGYLERHGLLANPPERAIQARAAAAEFRPLDVRELG